MQHIVHQELRDCTLIVIAHHLSTMTDFDQVIVMEQGKICEIGRPQDLLKRPSKFRSLYSGESGVVDKEEDIHKMGIQAERSGLT